MATQLVVIDKSVSGYQSLLSQIPAGYAVLQVDTSGDGWGQIATYMVTQAATGSGSSYSALHILGHGSAGSMQLGSSTLSLGAGTAFDGRGGVSVSGHQAAVRAYQSALPGPCQKHGATHRPVCVVQYLDGQRQAYAEDAGMSASTNRQTTETGRTNYWFWLPRGVIDAGVPTEATFSLMSGS